MGWVGTQTKRGCCQSTEQEHTCPPARPPAPRRAPQLAVCCWFLIRRRLFRRALHAEQVDRVVQVVGSHVRPCRVR